jgi:hypothetical protein
VAGTVAYGIWLIRSSGSDAPGWLWPVAVSLGAVAVVLLLASAVTWPHRTILAAALIVGTAAILVIPASGTAQIVAKRRGFGDTPFETAETAAANAFLAGSGSKRLVSVLPRLEKLQLGSPYAMAVSTSAVAAGFISATGKEILPIGGFTGTIPEPTISQLAGMVRAGKFHLALLIRGFRDPGLNWIASHCRHLVRRGGTIDLFLCTPNDASAVPG